MPGSALLHHGDGEITHCVENGITCITLQGNVTPRPDYKGHLMPKYVDTKAVFEAIKAQCVPLENMKAFENSACSTAFILCQ